MKYNNKKNKFILWAEKIGWSAYKFAFQHGYERAMCSEKKYKK